MLYVQTTKRIEGEKLMEKDRKGRNIIWYEGEIGNSKGTIAHLYDYQIKDLFTLDNIFKYASEDELRAIVSSIIGRLREQKEGCSENILNSMILLDADLDKLVKGLRDVK